jgi:hypothetical protein
MILQYALRLLGILSKSFAFDNACQSALSKVHSDAIFPANITGRLLKID